MMPTNDILPFALNGTEGTNLESQSTYASDAARTNGVVSGRANSLLYNKAQRQSAFMSNVLAQFICNESSSDVLDDGDSDGKVTLLVTAISTLIGRTFAKIDSQTLTGTPKAPTPASGDNTTRLATTAFIQAALAAYSPDMSGLPSLYGFTSNLTFPGPGFFRHNATKFMLQWNRVQLAAGSNVTSGTVTFSSSFANTNYVIVASPDNIARTDGSWYGVALMPRASTKTVNSCTIYADTCGGSTKPITTTLYANCLAIGVGA